MAVVDPFAPINPLLSTDADSTLHRALIHMIDGKTKPPGSLGRLEELALQMGMIQQTITPQVIRPVIIVFAGDHGIVAEGVSPYPQAVTAQMVANFLAGGAAINVFSRVCGVRLEIVNAGVAGELRATENLINIPVGGGTRNFAYQAAMTREETQIALARGAARVAVHQQQGANVIGFGEMGIGNTSAASCLMARLCSLPADLCVGRGTGLDDAGLARKKRVLNQALKKHTGLDPLYVLTTFGGFEIAMMTGAMLAAAAARMTIVIDGFTATSALLIAHKITPNILEYCVFSHLSDEIGHQRLLAHLNAKPLLALGLRLGEGTGAALAIPFLRAATSFLSQMASFDSAGVSNRS